MRKALVILAVAMVALSGSRVTFAKKKVEKKAKGEVVKAQELEKKAQEYWNHKVKREYYKMYDFECPEVRKKLTRDEYAQTFGRIVMLSTAKVEKVEKAEDNKAKVVVNLQGVIVPAAKKFTLPVRDPWRFDNNTWCHEFPTAKKPAQLPPSMMGTLPPPSEPTVPTLKGGGK